MKTALNAALLAAGRRLFSARGLFDGKFPQEIEDVSYKTTFTRGAEFVVQT